MAIFGVREIGTNEDCGTVQVRNVGKIEEKAMKAVEAIQAENCSEKIVAGKQYEVRFLFVG